jgi:hypothetical protein
LSLRHTDFDGIGAIIEKVERDVVIAVSADNLSVRESGNAGVVSVRKIKRGVVGAVEEKSV